MKSYQIMQFLEQGSVVSIDAETLLVGWGTKKDFETPKQTKSSPYFYFQNFSLTNKTPWFEHEHWSILSVADFAKILDFADLDGQICRQWSNPYKKIFVEEFYSLKDALRHGELQKAVPYVFEMTPGAMQSTQLAKCLKAALLHIRENPAYIYGTWDEHRGVLGATPELLVDISTNPTGITVKTVACAGSCPKVHAQQLKEDTKTLLEHYLVVEGIKKCLENHGEVSLFPLEIRHFDQISHLVTPIHLTTTQSISLEEMTSRLHPTPALGAIPLEEGNEWLTYYEEKVPRDYFGAPIGFQHGNQAKAYVGIRNAQWDRNSIKIGAGCGVIEQSVLDKEWKEIQWKMASIKKILAL